MLFLEKNGKQIQLYDMDKGNVIAHAMCNCMLPKTQLKMWPKSRFQLFWATCICTQGIQLVFPYGIEYTRPRLEGLQYGTQLKCEGSVNYTHIYTHM